jgi:hypothetical protein
MYRKFNVTKNLFLHSALFNDLNTASVAKASATNLMAHIYDDTPVLSGTFTSDTHRYSLPNIKDKMNQNT